MLGPVGFAAPMLLWALVLLPVLWLILRAVPPAPIRRRFPGVALLLGLKDDDSVTDRTPWWLLLLRMLAAAAVIVGLAGPVLNPEPDQGQGKGPLLIVMDGGWTGAQDWSLRSQQANQLLAEAARAVRPVAILRLTAPEPVQFQTPEAWRGRLAGFAPMPWEADATRALAALGDGVFDTAWLSDGVAWDGQGALLAELEKRGAVHVYESGRAVLGLRPVTVADGGLEVRSVRSVPGPAREVTALAHGRDPNGVQRVLARLPLRFEPDAVEASNTLILPAELRARITRFELEGVRSAGAVALTDDSLRRREVALIAGRDDREGLELLDPLHYLTQALAPTTDLLNGALSDVIPANPDVIILADVATLADAESTSLQEWADKGGLLIRFAGPRLAGSEVSRAEEDPLMPVRLRSGGRNVGGAMSWGEPKTLAPFREGTPFYGLPVAGDVQVSSQVMAQPDPTLADRVIAQLSDGTPLVTRKPIGQGQVVLFHVSANAEWSSLPLSGLFVRMLERLSVSSGGVSAEATEMAGTIWKPLQVLDGLGRSEDAGNLPGIDGAVLADARLGPDLRPGIYESSERRLALNALTAERALTPFQWPARIPVTGMQGPSELPLGGYVLAAAIGLLMADVLASLALSGRLFGARAVAMLLAAVMLPSHSKADDAAAIAATQEVVLAYVITGDAEQDKMSAAGLLGLSDVLFFRTSVEPAPPIGVNLEADELAFFPMIYWPITTTQATPSAEAYVRLNRYLRSGGMILFDTRDADIARFGSSSPNGRKLRQLAAPLDIPPLEPVPNDHVLTRSFYLLQDFPGRFTSRDVWVEAAPPGAEKVEGMPFRNLNDGVTPVVIGGNDWAAAWATDDRGNPLYPVGRGYTGERQRELAYRFGVNLMMHVLTGNYKSDQVHVPALLDRLGQ
ncbi:DUF4159 domain-containing protein [Thalassobius vesicularis]|uniref:DUF4159 domain-containing protein n=1 Tax=Thalassobius vesicularis TaxID=1294297 RepID=A0A4V3UZ26_9RHOB|nr:DUF4159 domain-containing protein [Thalassobius vesicularis]THD74147.1 DUF4159 domain-containing protein [Thalassobius vesicularis]